MGDGVIQYEYLQDSTYLPRTLNSCHMFKSEALFSPLLHLIIVLAFNRYLVVEFTCYAQKPRPKLLFFKIDKFKTNLQNSLPQNIKANPNGK